MLEIVETKKRSTREAFGKALLELGKENKNVVALDADLSASTQTKLFAKELSKDFVIISGLAMGVDAIAQRTAVESGGKTIGVLGNGLDKYYLKDNEDLFNECKKNHLVLTEYPDGVEPTPRAFPVRNRIIAGLCDTLLVTEGKVSSGTSITAMLMLQKNGNVCCIPTRIGEESICNRLISQGAFLVEKPEDIYYIADVPIKKPVFEK